ncbi:NUDIX hydrolase [Vulcanisaeta thermophila]|uniref:NUDIX hydrolase n=1 Tax=Vulcanisaeta thermophila TaxID=867917 RepID=UPI000852A975|nr:NUDIX hydrolase [Vulcanisaeta thermophila]
MTIIYQGRRVTLEIFETVLPNGNRMMVERVLFPSAVAALPIIKGTTDVVLIRQFRPVLNNYIIEIPAGIINPDEKPEEALIRELREEVGGVVDDYELMFQGYTSPGYSTEYLYLYSATLKYLGDREPEPHEVIEVIRLNIKDALRMLLNNEIRDHKTALALTLYAYRHGLSVNP